ncbi:putative NADPH:quinone oxidoreductase [Cocos nucifera]|uniref:NAD(P)H dehydrogenase (quinone) n=1 Tax=Cocos nucifera TaxID=13894 RepID=A0A8K0I6H7_COCNU|nr:putative NADPH:quinone oxidoreductase [Cocos nucifera]
MEAAAASLAAKPVIRVAAICGSLRKASFNRGLIRCAIELCNESIPGMKIEHVDIEPLPLINPDLEIDGKCPPLVEAFRQKILEADSILLASPEYNYSIPGMIELFCIRKISAAIELCNESIPGMKIEHVDIEPLPLINPDLEIDGKCPPLVEAFRQKILEADSILLASPEYNYSIPGMIELFCIRKISAAPLKNAIDWASRPPNVWADKPAAIVSAAGGAGGSHAQYHLRQVGVFLDLHFINKPELFIQAFQPPMKFDSDGNLIDPETKERLKRVLLSLQAFTHRLSRSS